jgi:hypothetical protein
LVDESSLGDLGRRAWRHALQTALMQRIEKTAQVLMRVLLPPKPKAAYRDNRQGRDGRSELMSKIK